MTQHVPPIPSIRLSPLRRGKGWLVGLVLAVAIIATGTVLLVSSDSGTSTSSRAVSTPVNGPNETARGAAAASAVSSPSPVGGVDETARGQAVASASR